MAPPTEEDYEVQNELHAVMDRLALVEPQSSLIRKRIDIPTRSVTVHWFGDIPMEAEAIRAQAAATGITIHVLAAPFSQAELNETRDRVFQRAAELGLSFLLPDRDGNGYTAEFRTTPQLLAAQQAVAEADARSATPGAPYDIFRPGPGAVPVRIAPKISPGLIAW